MMPEHGTRMDLPRWPGRMIGFLLLALSVAMASASGGADDAEPARLRVVGDNNYPPYLFLDPDGQTVGYVADLWDLWSRKTGIEVELEAVNWAEAQRRLLAGEADVIENIYRTPEREPLYDFSRPYAELPVAIYRHLSIDGIHAPRALRGFRIGVMEGDACVEILRQRGLDDLLFYPSYADLIRGALAEDIKLFCMDEYPANYYLYQLNAHKTFFKAFDLYAGAFHRAVRKGDGKTLRLVERGMSLISAAEEAAIRRQWMARPVDYGALVQSLGLIAALLALVGAGLLAWTQSLRRRVEAKTRELSAALRDVQQARGLIAASHDRLEQEVAERTAALAMAIDEQEAIFDTASSGIALIKDRILTHANRKLHELCGWPPGEMLGQPTRIWYPDAAGDAVGAAAYAAIWEGDTHTREQDLMRRDGSLFRARLSGRAIDYTDRHKGTVWVIDDISVEHQAIERMREARALAEQAERIKADFLANISHELRTPLNTVIGMTHLTLKTELTDRQRGYLSEIQQAGQRLLNIIDEILDFTRIEAGRLQGTRTPFAIGQIVEDVAALISGPCAAKRLALRVELDPRLPLQVVGDPVRLRQILIAFAKNAVKFTASGEILIAAQALTSDAQTMRLRIAVKDTGIGIDSARHQDLFAIFAQADSSTTRQFSGTGLGLALARRLAGLIGGEIGMDSTPGQGSAFWFEGDLDLHAPDLLAPVGSVQSHATTDAAADPEVAATPPDTTAPRLDPAALRALAQRLATQLAEDDYAALATLEQHRADLRVALGGHCEHLEQAISDYDFPAAARELAAAIGTLEVIPAAGASHPSRPER